MNPEIILLLALNVVTLIIAIIALKKINLAVYLLDQPIAKKIASSTKLNLKKVDRNSIDSGKPHKTNSRRLRSGSSGKDNRGPKNSRGGHKDRPKSSRPQRSPVRGDHARGTVVPNQSAQKDGAPAAAPADSTPKVESSAPANSQGHSHAPRNDSLKSHDNKNAGGRRKLPSRSENSRNENAVAPGNNGSSAPAASSAPAPQSSPAPDANIQHGRRTKIKKSPVFDD